METPTTKQVVEALGGMKAVAAKTGANYIAVGLWVHRNAIPAHIERDHLTYIRKGRKLARQALEKQKEAASA